MEKIASMIGLNLTEMYSLTLKEFNNYIEGYNRKEEKEWKKIAQLASWVISPHVKKPVSAEKLLKPKKNKETNVISLDEKRKYFEESKLPQIL